MQYNSSYLVGKAANKEALRKQIGLSFLDPMRPLVGISCSSCEFTLDQALVDRLFTDVLICQHAY